LDRASDYESEGREFESLRAHHNLAGTTGVWLCQYLARSPCPLSTLRSDGEPHMASHPQEEKALGRFEHFLPQFLLRAFAIPDGQKSHVFRFTAGRRAQRVGIKRTAGEQDFYGVSDGIDLETELSRYESRYAPALQRFRDGRQERTDGPVVAEFVNNLAARGKYYRTVFGSVLREMIDALLGFLPGPEFQALLRERLLRDLLNQPQIRALPPGMRALALAKAREMPLDAMTQEFVQGFRKDFDPDAITKAAHRTALARTFKEKIGAGAMASFTWQSRSVHGRLVLGDVGPVARLHGIAGLHIVHKDVATTDAVMLPISPDTLLIGVPAAAAGSEEVIDVDVLNRETVEICHEFFVSSTNGPSEAEYTTGLQTRPDPFANLNYSGLARESLMDINKQTPESP
jgi:hypothetical protein